MLKENLIKENIDGEALLWAYERLKRQQTRNKELFVFSDGAPVDDSTLSVNPGDFLQKHLVRVVDWITSQSDVTLHAIGIGHEPSRYYPNGVGVSELDKLGIPVLRKLRAHFERQDSL